MNKLKLLITCYLMLFSSQLVALTENESRRLEITALVKSFLQQQILATTNQVEKIEISVNSIDQRLKIKKCSQPLSLSLPGKNKLSRNTTVKVNCAEIWKMYIPAQIRRLQPVVVAAQSLSAGSLLNQLNLVVAYKDILTLHGSTIADISAITGSKIKRYVQQGQAITNNLICLVCKGDPVTIYARTGNLTIKSAGTALKDGSMGQVIAVKNTSSARRIKARVVAVSEVEINF
jgi:flagellar basal body P-ring formation protein FlgA